LEWKKKRKWEEEAHPKKKGRGKKKRKHKCAWIGKKVPLARRETRSSLLSLGRRERRKGRRTYALFRYSEKEEN